MTFRGDRLFTPRTIRYTRAMESKVARDAQEAMDRAVRRLTPEERLNAFLTHCELMMKLRAGVQTALSTREPKG